jgi:hypothetical protein
MENMEQQPRRRGYEQSEAEIEIRKFLLEIGLNPDKIKHQIIERLQLLKEKTGFMNDGRRDVRYGERLFKYYDKFKPEKSFSGQEKRTFFISAFISDIGKTGPVYATMEEQNLIVDIYAVSGKVDGQMSLEKFLYENFIEDAESRIKKLKNFGLKPSMTLREFYNLHSSWTLDLLDREKEIGDDAIVASAAHHILENVNPQHIINNKKNLHRAGKLLIIIDKYDAARKRGGATHEKAISKIKDILAESKYWRDDAEFSELLGNIEKAFG